MMNNGRRGARRGTAALSVLALVLALLNATVAAAAVSNRVELRVLVVDDGSVQIAAITEQLDIEGVPYTPVLLADGARPVITGAYLATGTEGHFQAVVMPSSTGTSRTSAPSLAAAEVAAITAYRTTFAVREVDVDEWPGVHVGLQSAGSAGTWSGVADGMTGTVTDAAKASGWGYLEGGVTFSAGTWAIVSTPLTATSSPAMPVGAVYTPYLTVEMPGSGAVGTVLGSYRSPGGAEQLVVTVGVSGDHQHFQLLAHGIVTWLTRGVHFGYQRAYYSQHFDDAFAYDARWDSANNCTPGEDCPPEVTTTTQDIRMTADDVAALVAWQVASGYQPTLAFNGYYALNDADGEPWTTTDPLTAALVAHRSEIRWLNHGYEHLYQGCQQDLSVVPWVCITVDNQPVAPDGSNLAWVSQAAIAQEILQNITLGNTLGLPFDPAEYLAGEHSGVAITPQQPADNPEFAAALAATGITSIGTDASRGSEQRVVGSALTVPRHPVAVYFNVSTVAEEVDEYNWIYLSAANGGSGYCDAVPVTCLPAPLSLETGFTDYIVPTDVTNSMRFVLRNDPRPFYAHVSNLTGPDRLGLQLMSATLDTYDSWFADNAPLLNLTLTQAATVLGNQQSWAATGMASDSPVTGYLQDGMVVVDNPTAVLAPLTVPEGTTISGQPFGESYGGERSGWVGGSVLLATPAAAAPVFTSAASATFTVGTAGSVTVSATAATSLAVVGSLPAGVTFVDAGNATGALAGTPAAGTGGTYPITLRATNLAGVTDQSFVLTVRQSPAFTSAATVELVVRTKSSFTVTSSGWPTPTLSIAGALPAGLTFTDLGNGTATISGKPATATVGTHTVTLTARNAAGSADQTLTILVRKRRDMVALAMPVRVSLDAAVTPGTERCVQLAGTGGLPADASGVFLNVTTVRPNGPGYVVVYPAAGVTAATLAPQASTVNFEPGMDVANSAFVDLSADGRVCYLTAGASSAGIILDVTGFTIADSGMVAQRAQRLLDTRAGVDHVGEITGPIAPRTVQTIQVSGHAGVPVGATAAIINVTVTGATTVGNLRVFSAGTAVPNTSVVNYAAGQDKASSAFVDLSADGRISFWSDSPVSAGVSPVQVIIDVVGYVVAETAYTSVTPTRVVDTRPGSGHVGPIAGALAARRVYSVPIADVGSIPADAAAIVVNVTAIQPSGVGNLRVFADLGGGSVTPPASSTINYIPGRDIPNQVLVPAGGVLNFWSDMAAGGTVHLAVDVVGFVGAD